MPPTSRLAWAISAMALVAAMGLGARWAAEPSPAAAPPTVAFVGADPQESDPTFTRFRDALGQMSGAAGPVIALQYHEGGGVAGERLRRAVEAASASRPTVLVLPTADSAAIGAALAEPPAIVFASFRDPMQAGLVASLRRPGRRITGVSLADDLHLKRLELLKDAFPNIGRVAVLVDRSWLDTWNPSHLTAAARATLALDLVVHTADDADELEQVMHSADAARADAWYIPPTYIGYIAEAAVIGHLKRLRVPGMHATENEVKRGAAMAYSQDDSFAIGAMAALTLRIVAGEDAATIPVERPRRFVLSVRARDAPDWGRVATSVVRRADRLY